MLLIVRLVEPILETVTLAYYTYTQRTQYLSYKDNTDQWLKITNEVFSILVQIRNIYCKQNDVELLNVHPAVG